MLPNIEIFLPRTEFEHLVKTVDKFAESVEKDKVLMEEKIYKGHGEQEELNKDFHTRLTVIETTTSVWLKVIGALTSLLVIINLINTLTPLFDK